MPVYIVRTWSVKMSAESPEKAAEFFSEHYKDQLPLMVMDEQTDAVTKAYIRKTGNIFYHDVVMEGA